MEPSMISIPLSSSHLGGFVVNTLTFFSFLNVDNPVDVFQENRFRLLQESYRWNVLRLSSDGSNHQVLRRFHEV